LKIILVFVIFCYHTLSAVTDIEVKDKWLTIEGISSYLKMSCRKLYGMIQRGEVPASKKLLEKEVFIRQCMD